MNDELQHLKNLGKTSAQWLHAVGIHSASDLRRLGAVDAYRAVRNKIADYERSHVKETSLDGMADEEGELPLLSLLAADNEEPFAAEERADRMHRLTDAIGKLEPRQRAILIATELKGKSFRDLAEEWGEPIGTLLSRKSRAVKTLRKLLEEAEV